MSDQLPDYKDEDLIKDLKEFWDNYCGENDPFAAVPTPAGTIYDALPEMDSLSAVDTLVAIEKYVGPHAPACTIRKGGYHSFNDMKNDLVPKARQLFEARNIAAAASAAAKAKSNSKSEAAA